MGCTSLRVWNCHACIPAFCLWWCRRYEPALSPRLYWFDSLRRVNNSSPQDIPASPEVWQSFKVHLSAQRKNHGSAVGLRSHYVRLAPNYLDSIQQYMVHTLVFETPHPCSESLYLCYHVMWPARVTRSKWSKIWNHSKAMGPNAATWIGLNTAVVPYFFSDYLPEINAGQSLDTSVAWVISWELRSFHDDYLPEISAKRSTHEDTSAVSAFSQHSCSVSGDTSANRTLTMHSCDGLS